MAGDHHHQGSRVTDRNGLRGGKTIDLRQRDVHQHHIRAAGLVGRERVNTVSAFDDLVRHRRQYAAHQLPDCGVVLHDQYPHGRRNQVEGID